MFFFDSRRMNGVPPNLRDTAMVFQNYALFPHLSVERNVAFGLEARGVARAEARRRVAEALRLVELQGLEARAPHELSGGQQQRVAVARAMVAEPALILADEPTGNLDSHASDEIASLLHRVASEWNRSVVMVTHDPRIAAYADRIIFLKDGKLVDETRLSQNGSESARVVKEKADALA